MRSHDVSRALVRSGTTSPSRWSTQLSGGSSTWVSTRSAALIDAGACKVSGVPMQPIDTEGLTPSAPTALAATSCACPKDASRLYDPNRFCGRPPRRWSLVTVAAAIASPRPPSLWRWGRRGSGASTGSPAAGNGYHQRPARADATVKSMSWPLWRVVTPYKCLRPRSV
eukprot:scaffold36143_cov31-Tisochrysis_lutea.AAC.6